VPAKFDRFPETIVDVSGELILTYKDGQLVQPVQEAVDLEGWIPASQKPTCSGNYLVLALYQDEDILIDESTYIVEDQCWDCARTVIAYRQLTRVPSPPVLARLKELNAQGGKS
jgi:hypothetical protein